ncbi:6-phosphofructokinase, alpha subunit [Entomophthora muscae]|uniref:6-phosphofructokinase, alpha subunit n=1 Tax=Entomophthora muscae TaxID=34485 RepID=A0ACC2ST94_9FUNG|nr:6-phosphofructokinase, alpha subunit [Entomophthora muscae]
MSLQEDTKSSKVETVPEQSYIAGLTNLSLACPLSKCSELVEFYEKIGFKKVSNPQESSAKGVWMILDLAKAGICISSKSYIEYNQPSGGKEVFLHLDFSDEEASIKPNSSIAPSFCVPDLKRFKTYLESAKVLHKLNGDNITAFDPLENKLIFTTRLHPFSTGKAKVVSNHPRIISPTDDLPKLPHKQQESSEPRKRIAVLTSGGDSQGMNCAVRAVVRAAIARDCEAYFIHEGYQGLVDGGDKICKASWGDVRKFVSVSGTIIGTARCMDFKTREGRLKGAENLIINGIDALVVIGGDGSLTGADLFRSEWKTLVADLVSQKRITQQQASVNGHLTIVGLVGSIDNDMAGTDFTIGAVSSLHRICESVDNVTSTALSHKRAFVIEVMGRHCGWLALMAAVCTGADFVFIPEQPMDREEWKEKMCADIKAHRGQGRRATIVIVSEGAIDRDLKPIRSEDVAAVIEAECDLITRVTNLGHVQRGGVPASYDRVLGAVQGIQAVDVILKSTPTSDSKLIAIQNNMTAPVGLMEAVQKTKDIASLVAAKRFDEAMQLRDPYFSLLWNAYCHSGFRPASTPTNKRLRIGILHIGAPAGGMNAATRTLARLAINAGHTPVAFPNGIRGLLEGESSELGWLQVANWTPRGGSEIGTNRDLPDVDYGLCAYQLQKHRISCLFIVGGFEAYRGVAQLAEQRSNFPAFCVPIAYIPATISNNVPGADYSLGCDTSLNAITEACDRIVQSAASSHSRTFVVEVQGGNSGFLATLGGLSVGASRIYTPEEGITLKDLEQDVAQMKTKFIADSHRKDSANVGRVVLVSDGTSKTYTTEMISAIFTEEGAPLFDSRTAVLGHIQQGGTTSPVDRIHAVMFAHRAFFWLMDQCESSRQGGSGPAIYTKDPSSAVVIGTTDGKVTSTPVQDLDSKTDWVKRRPRHAWWHKGFAYNRLLSHYAVIPETQP